MISWIVIKLLFWHYQKLCQTRPGGQNIVRYFDPPLYIFPHLPHPPNNRWKTVVCISYLLDKIYHYIKIISMISWVVIILLFWHYQKLFQLRVKILYDILTDSPKIINDKVLFAIHIGLITFIDISTSSMISFLCSSNAFNFYTAKNYPNLTRGVKIIVWYFDTPPPLIIYDKVLFAFHIYLRKCIIISKSCLWFLEYLWCFYFALPTHDFTKL